MVQKGTTARRISMTVTFLEMTAKPSALPPPAPRGRHAIRVVREGYEPFERTVQIVPGQAVRLTDIVLVERHP